MARSCKCGGTEWDGKFDTFVGTTECQWEVNNPTTYAINGKAAAAMTLQRNGTGSPCEWVLTLQCPDRPGIVHAVTGAIEQAAGNITELQQFSSDDTARRSPRGSRNA